MKNKIKIVYVIIRIIKDDNGFGCKQTALSRKTENVTTKHVKSSKMSFMGGNYAYTEEDGLYPVLN